MSEDLLHEAIAAWRSTRDPRWARIARAASERALSEPRPVVGGGRKKSDDEAWDALAKANDALDLPRLVAALRLTSAAEAARRVEVLARRDDPRLVDELLAILEAPPWRANVFKEFVKAALAALASAGDVRAREALGDLAGRYKAIVETSVGDWVGTQLAQSAAAMSGVAPRPSTPALAARLAECERSLGPAPAPRKPARSDAELLAMVHATPDDDGPRLVFADALLERGDERGEFIQLQIARASGRGTREGLVRERALARDPKRLAAWALPLSNGGTVRFRRGFVAQLTAKPAAARKVLGEPALATVERVDGLQAISAKLAIELLDDPGLRRVHTVAALPQPVLDRLVTTDRPWRELTTHGVPSNALLRSLRALRTLTLFTVDETPLPPGLFEDTQLDTLFLEPGQTGSVAPDLLAPLGGLSRLSLGYVGTQKEPRVPPTFLAAQRALSWLSIPHADALYLGLAETVRVETLRLAIHHLTREQALAFVATQPALRELESTSTAGWLRVPFAAELLGSPTLTRVVCSGGGWSLDRDGTLELETMSGRTLEPLVADAASFVRRVRVVERVFDGDPLAFTSLDEAQIGAVRQWADARGIPVETP